MFDVYMEARTLDPRARSRLAGSTGVAIAACIALGGMLWTGGKLGIDRVRAPKVESILILQGEVVPPPPASPPPAPKGSKNAAAADDAPEEPELDDPDPLPDPELEADPPPTPSGPSDGVPGVPDGVGGPSQQGPLCVMPPCGTGDTPGAIGKSVVPRRRVQSEPEMHKPIRAVRAQALYAPDPKARELRLTPTGRTSGRGGRSTVSFCVGIDGKVGHVRTTKAFPGDPEVDRICRETVKRWRFKPFLVDSRPRRTCSTVTFSIEFE